MAGTGGTFKNAVYRCVLAGDAIIDNLKQFADFSHKVCNDDPLLFPDDSLIQELEQMKYAKPIPHTLQTHKIAR